MTTPADQQAQPIQKRGARGLIVLLLSMLAWAPLLHPGFIQTHSGLGAIYDALPARSLLSGWPPGDGPLAPWLLAVLQPTLSPLASLKLLYAAGFILAGVGMYMLARRSWGAWPALVASTVYMLIPYRLAAVYVRGALAETLLLALAPALLVALERAARTPRWYSLINVGLIALLLTLAHPGLGASVTALALLWTAVNPIRAAGQPANSGGLSLRAAIPALAGAGLGLAMLMSAGGRFLASVPGWSDHFVHFYQLFSPVWGFGESVADWQDNTSFQLGLAPVALAIVALWGAIESSPAQRRAVLILSALAAALVLLTLTVAAPVWHIVPLSALVAYPWQFLGVAALPLALLAAAAAHFLMPPDKPASMATLAVLLCATVLASYPYLAPRYMAASDVPDLSHPPLAQLGDEILLLDARWDNEGRAGGAVKLTLTWQALRQPSADYTVFAHLVDEQGVQRGQTDVRPHNDQLPTNTWLRGEVVHDEISVPVKAGAPPGQYRVNVGMYSLATMQRLPVAGSDQGQVVLGPISIR